MQPIAHSPASGRLPRDRGIDAGRVRRVLAGVVYAGAFVAPPNPRSRTVRPTRSAPRAAPARRITRDPAARALNGSRMRTSRPARPSQTRTPRQAQLPHAYRAPGDNAAIPQTPPGAILARGQPAWRSRRDRGHYARRDSHMRTTRSATTARTRTTRQAPIAHRASGAHAIPAIADTSHARPSQKRARGDRQPRAVSAAPLPQTR